MQIGQWVNSFLSHVANRSSFDTGFNTNRKDWKHKARLVFRNLSLERKSCLFQQHLYLMCWLWDPMWWPLSAVALVIDPCYCCGSPLLPMFASSHSLPVAADFNCTGALAWLFVLLTVVLPRTKTMRAAALAGLNRMFVQWLQALLEELDQRRSSTAWSQNPQARGARLSERKQMVTWIVQHVPSTPALCLACSTLPQQTLLIIDVLEWPHHHWILQTGRNIKVITAPLTYLLY